MGVIGLRSIRNQKDRVCVTGLLWVRLHSGFIAARCRVRCRGVQGSLPGVLGPLL